MYDVLIEFVLCDGRAKPPAASTLGWRAATSIRFWADQRSNLAVAGRDLFFLHFVQKVSHFLNHRTPFVSVHVIFMFGLILRAASFWLIIMCHPFDFGILLVLTMTCPSCLTRHEIMSCVRQYLGSTRSLCGSNVGINACKEQIQQCKHIQVYPGSGRREA
jgi:hypothetical protein